MQRAVAIITFHHSLLVIRQLCISLWCFCLARLNVPRVASHSPVLCRASQTLGEPRATVVQQRRKQRGRGAPGSSSAFVAVGRRRKQVRMHGLCTYEVVVSVLRVVSVINVRG